MGGLIRRYLLPGLLFQSVVVSGGYSTGRELVEFFMRAGPASGLLGMVTTMAIWSVLLALTFEFARRFRAYDYRRFFRALLGPAWPLFELAFLALAVVVLAVVGAAAGALVAELTGLPPAAGTAALMAVIGVLVFYGTRLIERVVAWWSFVLYVAYLGLFVFAVTRLGGEIGAAWSLPEPVAVPLGDAVAYAGINIAAAPAILFGLAHLRRSREAVVAGLLAGPIAMIPALLFYVILLARYPGVLEQEVPLLGLLAGLDLLPFAVLFQLVLLGTYVETGTAMVHSVNERIAGYRAERGRATGHGWRLTVALTLLVVSIYLATAVGLVDLIAKGFRALTWAFWLLYALPLMTVGVWRLLTVARLAEEAEKGSGGDR